VYKTQCMQDFDIEFHKLDKWHLHSIKFSHNEAEEFGLDSSLHVLFAQLMIEDMENEVKADMGIKN